MSLHNLVLDNDNYIYLDYFWMRHRNLRHELISIFFNPNQELSTLLSQHKIKNIT